MNAHKKLGTGALALALFLVSACGQAPSPPSPSGGAATLRFSVSAEPYPPFASKNAAGEWEGLEVDFARALCAEMKVEGELVATTWDGIIPALQAKKFDLVVASMSVTEERQKAIAFSIPYYKTPAVLVAAAGAGFQIDVAQSLAGKTIGVQTGTIHQNHADAFYKDIATVKVYGTQDEANADLAAGRVDATIADSTALEPFLAEQAGKFAVVGTYPKDLPVWGSGVAVGMRKEDVELKAKVDGAIRAVFKSGKFDAIRKKYTPVDIGTPPAD